MSNSVTFVCVLRSGGDFLPMHVERLARALHANDTGVPLVCLSDAKDAWNHPGIVSGSLLYGMPGWWSMLEMFRVQGPAIYLDLDVVLRESIEPLIEYVSEMDDDEVLMLKPWNSANRHEGIYATGITCWHGDMRWLAKKTRSGVTRLTFHRDGMVFGGTLWKTDQHFITNELTKASYRIKAVQDIIRVQSYKRDLGQKIEKATAPVVVFHGTPRPWEVGL